MADDENKGAEEGAATPPAKAKAQEPSPSQKKFREVSDRLSGQVATALQVGALAIAERLSMGFDKFLEAVDEGESKKKKPKKKAKK